MTSKTPNFYRELKRRKYPYIIAEIGSNHNGDMRLAKKMIEVASEIGCDAVKFQSYTVESLFAKGHYPDSLQKCEISETDHILLKDYCDKKDITFCSTPFSIDEVDILDDLGVPFFKVASPDLVYLDFLTYIARKGRPIILSTGMANTDEIREATEAIYRGGNTDVILLHCVSAYPPDDRVVNLRNIQMLKDMFQLPVGYSDHTLGIAIPLGAVAMGAKVIEKHFTIDKDELGAESKLSADVDEMKAIVEGSKRIIDAQGLYERAIGLTEFKNKMEFRRSVVAKTDLKKGHFLKRSDIDFKRPETGIRLNETGDLFGSELNRDIEKNEIISWGDLTC